MHCANIGNHANLWQRQIAQETDFTRDVKTHFQHGYLVTRTQTQQGQGQADFVVEVARVFQHPEAQAEHFGNQFFGR